MKKIISLVIVFSLILSVNVFAESSSMEQVLKIVKERIPSTEQFDRMDSKTSVNYEGKTTYRFNWMSETDESYDEMSVTVTESGIITNYYAYGKSEQPSEKPSINRKTLAEVLPVAESFVKKINPDIYGSLKISAASGYESLSENSYEYELQRYENGLPVYGDRGYVTVSRDGETVESFYIKYTEGLTVEPAEKLISAEQAQAAYSEKLGMKLYYTTVYENKQRQVVAVYAPAGGYNEYISAVNGEVIRPIEPDYSGENYKFMSEESVTADSAVNGAGRFTEAEKAELAQVEKLISKEQAAEIVLKNKVLGLDDSYTAQYFNLNKDYYDTDRYYWNISFESENGYADAQVDAVSGRITSFYKKRSYSEEEKIATEMARKAAVTAISGLAPEYFPVNGESPYVMDEYEGDYIFNWTRYENGIPFEGGNAYVEIDMVDGSVVGYYLKHDDLEFPALDNIIDEESAAKKMFEQNKYEAVYIKSCSEEGMKSYDTGVAVYRLEDAHPVLKADNGEPLYDNYGQYELTPYGDIKGHFAETAAETLRKYGVGFAGGEFRPDEIITQGDLTLLLNSIFGRGYSVIIAEDMDYTDAYYTATRNGILKPDEKAPDTPVTREVAAVMIIRAMGLEEAASLEGIYNCPFADVTKNKGYVSILGAMGVFRGDSAGNFNPSAQITRGEAAVALYNYLNR